MNPGMHTLDAGIPIDDSANDGGQSGREPTRVKQPSETVLADAINFMAAIARTLGTSIILQGLDFEADLAHFSPFFSKPTTSLNFYSTLLTYRDERSLFDDRLIFSSWTNLEINLINFIHGRGFLSSKLILEKKRGVPSLSRGRYRYTYSRNSVILNEEGSYTSYRQTQGKDLSFLPSRRRRRRKGWGIAGFEEVSGREKGDVFSGQQQISYD